MKPTSIPRNEAQALDGKPLARGRKSTKKRETIIRAAIEIINKKSFALATMSDIAASIDLRDATLYYYFPNKQALVYDCHVRSLERFERLIVDATAFDGNGLERIKQFVRTLIDDHSRTAPNCTLETIRTLSRSSAIISQRGPIDCGTCLRLF